MKILNSNSNQEYETYKCPNCNSRVNYYSNPLYLYKCESCNQTGGRSELIIEINEKRVRERIEELDSEKSGLIKLLKIAEKKSNKKCQKLD